MKITKNELIRLYNKGLSDHKIADLKGVCYSTIKERRYKLGLKAHSHSTLTIRQMKLRYNRRLNKAIKRSKIRGKIVTLLYIQYPKIYSELMKKAFKLTQANSTEFVS